MRVFLDHVVEEEKTHLCWVDINLIDVYWWVTSWLGAREDSVSVSGCRTGMPGTVTPFLQWMYPSLLIVSTQPSLFLPLFVVVVLSLFSLCVCVSSVICFSNLSSVPFPISHSLLMLDMYIFIRRPFQLDGVNTRVENLCS